MTDASDDLRDDPRFHLLNAILDAYDESGLDLDGQLRALTIVWVQRAQRLRGDALALPGSYTAEKARQLDTLAEMTAAVADDQPDLEAERLCQEGDIAGRGNICSSECGSGLGDGRLQLPEREAPMMDGGGGVGSVSSGFSILLLPLQLVVALIIVAVIARRHRDKLTVNRDAERKEDDAP